MKPSGKQLAIARKEGGYAAFHRPSGMSREELLKLCPYQNNALALAWRNSVRLHFSVQRGWPGQGDPTSADPEA